MQLYTAVSGSLFTKAKSCLKLITGNHTEPVSVGKALSDLATFGSVTLHILKLHPSFLLCAEGK